MICFWTLQVNPSLKEVTAAHQVLCRSGWHIPCPPQVQYCLIKYGVIWIAALFFNLYSFFPPRNSKENIHNFFIIKYLSVTGTVQQWGIKKLEQGEENFNKVHLILGLIFKNTTINTSLKTLLKNHIVIFNCLLFPWQIWKAWIKETDHSWQFRKKIAQVFCVFF